MRERRRGGIVFVNDFDYKVRPRIPEPNCEA